MQTQGLGHAGFEAIATGLAGIEVHLVNSVHEGVNPVATLYGAQAAQRTQTLIEHQNRAFHDRLGIVAPLAAQGTTLQEHRRADPGAVIDAIALDAQQPPGHRAIARVIRKFHRLRRIEVRIVN